MVGLPMKRKRRSHKLQQWVLRNQRGFVLISSYLVVAVLLVLQGAYFTRITDDLHLTERNASQLRAIHYADGGLDMALTELADDSGYTGTDGTVTLGNGA